MKTENQIEQEIDALQVKANGWRIIAIVLAAAHVVAAINHYWFGMIA